MIALFGAHGTTKDINQLLFAPLSFRQQDSQEIVLKLSA
jgi:hypothetical protein